MLEKIDLGKKKILVTGADGFIGSHLTEMLVRSGYNVKALVQYNSFNSWGWLDHSAIASEVEIITGDVRDLNICRKLCSDREIVFNLAALISIPYSYDAPQSFIDTNINGASNICQAAMAGNCESLLHTSTSEVYGSARYVPIDENHPLHAQSPYSASKIGSDAIVMSYYYSFELPVVIVRPFNTYGPRQSARAVIPTIITQILNRADTIHLGDTSPTRDFTFVEDTCKGFIALAECKNSIGEVVNLGSNYEISIGDLAERIKHLMGSAADIASDHERIRPKNSEVNRLWCDNTKLKRLTGFSPRTDIQTGLQRTIEWFQEPSNIKMYKPGLYNV